ncbi:MAG: ferrochelatase [Planctomycetota bacterium]
MLAPDSIAAPTRRTGVLLANLGTPRSPSVADVRAYLREFLSDPRVVRAPRAVWLPLLYGIILPFRAPRSAELYAKVWGPRGSPLLANSLAQKERLQARLGASFQVELCMRYGEPTLRSAVEELRRSGCERAILVPMFPQYSHTTTGSLEEALRRITSSPTSALQTTVVPPYFVERAYIRSVAERVRTHLAERDVGHTVFSFHGIPLSYVRAGDPYRDQCEATVQALVAELGLAEDDWSLVYQSRFGPQAWLEPLAEARVPELASRHARVAVVLPGFTADCLETIEEIGIRLRERFLAAGGEELVVVPALNDSPAWIDALAELTQRAASGTVSSARPGV